MVTKKEAIELAFKKLMSMSKEELKKEYLKYSMRGNMDKYLEAKIIGMRLNNAGGRAYFVGGYPRDVVINNVYGTRVEASDFDIEVYDLLPNELENILAKFGSVNFCGKQFGVYNINGIEIALPRREKKRGEGHKGFDIVSNPYLPMEIAVLRRDLKMNSIFMDMNGKIIDPYDGTSDIKKKILSFHNIDSFREDPLRVYRVAQFMSRFLFKPTDELTKVCTEMVESGELDTIHEDRLFAEWSKLLIKGKLPSYGLAWLKSIGLLKKYYPMFDGMEECEQSERWHPEGNVWTHTKLVINYASKFLEFCPNEWKVAFMFGALLHDIGKPICKAKGIDTNNHSEEGVIKAIEFLNKITHEKDLIDKVISIVKNHMRMCTLEHANKSAWKRLHNVLPIDIALAIRCADTNGERIDNLIGKSEMYIKEFGRTKIKPILMGRHLIDKGLKPGIEFKEILNRAYEIQIEEDINDVDELYILAAKKIDLKN